MTIDFENEKFITLKTKKEEFTVHIEKASINYSIDDDVIIIISGRIIDDK